MLSAGARLGPYELLSLVGAGGMGEVYKARDTRLNRFVAVKLLPVDAADRPDRRARFRAEARAISALQHPNICTLFDVGDEDGRDYLVMEYLEGETLDDRLAAGPLASAEVIRYAIEIVAALDHAHREGIVHRDLKPANVMLTDSGAKLLDFGLARAPAPAIVGETATLSLPEAKLTAEGTLVGTFQYMAPEQLEGRDADARTDLFAFGTVLYEMATGRRAFSGDSHAILIASILTGQPPAMSSARRAAVTDALPAALDHLVERCLAKQPAERWQTARDLKLELEWISTADPMTLPVRRAPRARRRRDRMAWAIAGAAAALALAAAVPAFVAVRARVPTEVTRFVVAPSAGAVIPIGEQRTRIAVSPDGRHLAFVALAGGRMQIWLRSLASLDARPLPGTEDGQSPFWSPDSAYVGFFTPGTGEIKKVALAGGPARTICSAQMEGLPDWGADGTILFSIFRDGVFRVSADGGAPARVTALDKSRRELNHFWPGFLPDGRHFTYVVTARDSDTSKAAPSVYVATLDGRDRRLLPRMHSRVVYAAPGYLLFVEEGALLAQRFDLGTLRPSGDAIAVADRVAWFETLGTGHFSVSTTGVLAYLGIGDPYRIMWYDRRGNATDAGWATQAYGALRISPDGQHVAADVLDPKTGTADVWIHDLGRNVPSRFTSERASDRNPVWSPDGRRVVFSTERGGSPNLFAKPFDESGDLVPMVRNPGPLYAEDWSSDNRWIVYRANTPQGGTDLWLKPLDGDRKEQAFLTSRSDEWAAKFSPDSAWLAFVSNETNGTPQVYVAPVSDPGRRRQISIDGGTAPSWRGDGKELFYSSPDNRVIFSVPIESLAPLRAGIPTRLFTIGGDVPPGDRLRSAVYDVMPDGQRFLVSVPAGEPPSSRITVVLNWTAAVRR